MFFLPTARGISPSQCIYLGGISGVLKVINYCFLSTFTCAFIIILLHTSYTTTCRRSYQQYNVLVILSIRRLVRIPKALYFTHTRRIE